MLINCCEYRFRLVEMQDSLKTETNFTSAAILKRERERKREKEKEKEKERERERERERGREGGRERREGETKEREREGERERGREREKKNCSLACSKEIWQSNLRLISWVVLLWNITGSDVDLSGHQNPGTLTPLWLRLWSAHRIMQNDAIRSEFCGSIGVFGVVMAQP